MILYVEKNPSHWIQKLVMVPFGNTKIHHVALWRVLDENYFIIQTLILVMHYEHSL
jgi:hypothetical protein